MDPSLRYSRRGVSSKKEDVHRAIEKLDKGLSPTTFCKVIPDHLTDDPAYCMVMHSDGAGTKSSLAYAYYRALKEGLAREDEEPELMESYRTKCANIWKHIAQDSLVMNLDDLICVGAVDCPYLLSSTVNRNKHLVDGEMISGIINGTQKVVDELQQQGVNIVLTGGETADMPDLVRTVVIDSTLMCRMKRTKLIDMKHVVAGDVIIGLASFGQASYETAYNSGMGSNGLTSARHDVFNKAVQQSYPECYDTTLPDDIVFTGKYGLTDLVSVRDDVEESKKEYVHAAEFVLSPTRTYAPIIKEVLSCEEHGVHGIIHCSGGGQTKVLHFLNKEGDAEASSTPGLKVVKDTLFPTPKLFSLIQEQSKTKWEEMYSVFNMGHRMELYCDKEAGQRIIEVAARFNVEAKAVGYVAQKQKLTEPTLTIQSQHGQFHYHS